MRKRLYRSRVDSKIAGVCGGLADYFDVDPTLIRIIFLLMILAHGVGLIAYIVAWIAMPRKPFEFAAEPSEPTAASSAPTHNNGWSRYLPGAILILIGGLFLLDHLFWWFGFSFALAIVLVLLGALLIFTAGKKEANNINHQQHAEVL
ncbi:conserved hypothetical protein [Candidatus Zixiibacteriota bacterium]|nr:conserved hypothetical protein [candidate division Zixibacteria bacterium]